MKNYIVSFTLILFLLPLLYSCKTTEENYRAAYEKTVAKTDDDAPLESAIYGTERKLMGTYPIKTPDGTVDIHTQLARLTDGTGDIDNYNQFNVVVGQFKQVFNAKSLCDRYIKAGYPAAFVVETAEPYYYIVAESYDDVFEAAKALKKIKEESPMPMKEPCPFILDTTSRRRSSVKSK
ncbi:MAG: SPOR domain-containing protein [Muribaculaceae bacterium]|nr:SPOR domain-containing protein [Muribaculaceae bacterium]